MQTIKTDDVIRYLKEYDPSLQLGEQIGKGGTSVVYDLPGTVPPQVLKVMDTRNDSVPLRKMWAYFHNEIRTMQELKNCPYIIPIYSFYEYVDPVERGLPDSQRRYRSIFLIRMAKLTPLTDYLEKHPLTEPLMVQMAIHVCRALQVCEAHRILHRDVKPGNIFVLEEKGVTHFILGDFGFCRRLNALDGKVTHVGTPAFIAPEVYFGVDLHGRLNADIYSLGSSLYFLLSGRKFPNRFYQKGELLDSLPQVSKQLTDIILKAVQPNPENRYQHVSEMLTELKQLQDASIGIPVDSSKQPAPERPPEPEPAPVRPDTKRPAAAPWTPSRKVSVGTPIPLLDYWNQHQLSETFLRQMAQQLTKKLITCEAQHIPFPAITPQNIYCIVTVNGDVQFRFGSTRPNHDSAYTAPEVLQGKRADSISAIFSLGTVLYALVAAQYRYYFKKGSTLPFSSDYSCQLAHIILTAIQPKRQHRYHSLEQMLDDLNHL